MIVPAGLLQPPVYYGPRLPRYLTYGAFGAIMGHEMSHGEFADSLCSIEDPS